MSDNFSLNDAMPGQGNTQNQNWNNNPWGSQNPGQQGFPGQQNPGYPQGQQYPGFPGQAQSQQYPGYPPAGQQYPGNPSFPGPGQQYPGAPTPGQGSTAPSGPLKVPCELPLHSGCTKGMMLTVIGVPTGKRFNIDFKEGNNIALHVNPRFDEKPNVIVYNSMIGGAWGKEERPCTKFPFQQGQQFRLQVLFDHDNYKVAVNNESICQYQHRVKNFPGITCIRIDGALTISDASITMV